VEELECLNGSAWLKKEQVVEQMAFALVILGRDGCQQMQMLCRMGLYSTSKYRQQAYSLLKIEG
jgi:hypothetical protein